MPRRAAWFAAGLAGVAALLAGGLLEARQVYREKSLYRDILVYDEEGLRCMRFGFHDRGRQTCISLSDPRRLVFDYTRMVMGALYLKPDPANVLVIGLGGGTLPSALRSLLPQARIDCVELDPSVVKVARRYFGFAEDPRLNVHVDDGRVFVKRALKRPLRYDLIVLDAFDHVYIPEHLLTREYLGEVRNLLSPQGVLAANTFSNSRLYDAESATYAAVFGRYYNLDTVNRVILTRRDGLPGREVIEANAARLEPQLRALGTGRQWLLPLFSTQVSWPAGTRILTDQYSPANLLNSGS